MVLYAITQPVKIILDDDYNPKKTGALIIIIDSLESVMHIFTRLISLV